MQLLFLSAALLAIGLKAPGKTAWPEQKSVTRDSSVLPAILSLPLSSYIGKPVDSLFSVLPPGYTSRVFMPLRVSYCAGVSQSYFVSETNAVLIQVFIDNYQYMVFPNRTKTRSWDMNLARKEKIAYIKIIKNNNICIYGCDNPNYDY